MLWLGNKKIIFTHPYQEDDGLNGILLEIFLFRYVVKEKLKLKVITYIYAVRKGILIFETFSKFMIFQ